MLEQVTIALDGMGGDKGPQTILAGAELALLHKPRTKFLIYGDEAQLKPILRDMPALAKVSTIHHCDVSISMEAKPSQALRQGRKVSSMWQAIDAVRQGKAQGIVSAGNTGALMAMSKIILKTLPGIERPAIACFWPTIGGEAVVLDVGATIGGTARQYVQFAVMGDAYARIIFGLENPRIGILNIGEEEMKGTDDVKEAAELLAESPLNFTGFVEGNGIGQGAADVIVTDGFTGNIALKTAEGTAVQFASYLRHALNSSFMSKIGYLLARPAFQALKMRMDPNNANGGMFLGLNGIVVKSHGGANHTGIASAIDLTIEIASAGIATRIADELDMVLGTQPTMPEKKLASTV